MPNRKRSGTTQKKTSSVRGKTARRPASQSKTRAGRGRKVTAASRSSRSSGMLPQFQKLMKVR